MPRIEIAENQKEKSPLEKNQEILKVISIKVGQYLDFLYGSRYMSAGHHQSFSYPKKDWPCVEKLFADIPERLSDLSKNESIDFHQDNSLGHILGNYALMSQQMVEGRRMQRNISSEAPLSPEARKKMIDLTPQDIEMFQDYKEEWDLILYYLEMIEKNPEILEMEMASNDGWLGEFRDFFEDKKIPVMEVRDQLKQLNFFSRLSHWHSELGDVRGLGKLIPDITEESFQELFQHIPKKELLGEKLIRQHFFGKEDLREAA